MDQFWIGCGIALSLVAAGVFNWLKNRRVGRHREGTETMTIFLSLLVALIGLLCYVLASNPKVQELGRIAWGCGLLAFLMKVAEPLINILGR